MTVYFPRIDHARRQALRVKRFPGKKICARISVINLRTRIPARILVGGASGAPR